jgi:putative transposase
VRVLQLAGLRLRSHEWNELEIVVLRHELAILRRRTRCPTITAVDRTFLAAASRLLSRSRWTSFIVTPATIRRWHRRLVGKRWTYVRPTGRPPLAAGDARSGASPGARQPAVGYQRIVSELKGLGMVVSATTVRTRLRAEGVGPAGKRRGMTWREFIRAHQREPTRGRFLHGRDRTGCGGSTCSSSSSRAAARVHLAGCTRNPNAAWVIQQGRQLMWTFAERGDPLRFLIRDRDQTFTDGVDQVFGSDGIEVVRTPFRAPQANGGGGALRADRSVGVSRLATDPGWSPSRAGASCLR